MISLSDHRLGWLLACLLAAGGLASCAESRTVECLNGIRCPADMICVEPHGYCASPEDVAPCLRQADNTRCKYLGHDIGICRKGVCELDDCESNLDCNDGNPCTRGTCVGERCEYEPLSGVSCDDGNFCNGADTCLEGRCSVHSGDPCTKGNTHCDPVENACVNCAGDSECPDDVLGDWGDCTGAGEVCAMDGIQSRMALTFACEEASSGTICRSRGGVETQACTRTTDGLSCNDGSACTVNDQCAGGSCQGQARICDDGNECTENTCNPELGCRHDPLPFGRDCGAGQCNGMGACITCDDDSSVGTPCSTGNPCEQGEVRCVGGAPQCVVVGVAPAGTMCRPAAGACDLPEVCNGVSPVCPADARQPAGTVCRAAAGICDVAETCDGSSTSCPADGFQGVGTVCRASAGDCDVAEACTGTSAFCPADSFQAPGTVCRAVAGDCDVAEACTGTSAFCPADSFQAPGTVCRAASDRCDAAEVCTGTSGDCPPDVLEPAGTVCRDAVDSCDIAETCDGSTASCPADRFEAAGTVCRAVVGNCDVAETCTGTSGFCPADGFLAVGTLCRAAAGICDVAETCTGTSGLCPADVLRGPETVCRAAAGDCDVAETCTGTSVDCPPDVLVLAGTVCRAAVDRCDLAESCDGSIAICPADEKFTCPAGTYCYDDGNVVNDVCFARPTITVLGGEGEDNGVQCGDQGIPHSCSNTPDFAVRIIITGRPNAPFRYMRRHVSCPGSIPAEHCRFPCEEGNIGELDENGICTHTLRHENVIDDCDRLWGLWELYAEIDGFESNREFFSIYNSTASCPAKEPPRTCAEAFSFCPHTGAFNDPIGCNLTDPDPTPPVSCPAVAQ